MKEAESTVRCGKELIGARSLIDHIPDGIARFDRDGRIIDANPAFERQMGVSRERMIGAPAGEPALPPETAVQLTQAFQKIISGTEEERFETRSGERVLQARIVPERDENGELVSFIGILRDTTGHERPEERQRQLNQELIRRSVELDAERKRWKSVVEGIADEVWIADAHGRMSMVNLPEVTHMELAAFENKTVGQVLEDVEICSPDGEPRPAEQAPLLRALKGETIRGEEIMRSRATGRVRWRQFSASPVRDAQGAIIGSVAVVRDITHQKRLAKEVEESRDAAQKAAREAGERMRILSAILRTIPEGIVILEAPDGRMQFVSKYYEDFFGISFEQLKTMSLAERIGVLKAFYRDQPGLSKIEDIPSTRALRKGEVIINEEWKIQKHDGTSLSLSVIAAPVRDEKGVITHSVAAYRDITANKKLEEALRRSEYELRTLVDNSPDLIVRFDRSSRYTYANAAFERITGLTKEQMIGKTNKELGMAAELERILDGALAQVSATGSEASVEFEVESIFGKRFFLGKMIPEFGKSGLVETVMLLARDITERKKAEDQIRYISFHDALTGLFNRAFFEEEIRRMDAGRDLPLSIILGDVNFLKLTNDAFGHDEGDRLLTAVASIVRASCREGDIVARWGGDEFIVALPRTDRTSAEAVCARISEAAREYKDTIIQISIALGVAVKERGEQNVFLTIRQAEERMYENKLAESKQNQDNALSFLIARVKGSGIDIERHIDRSCDLALRFGRELNLVESQLDDLGLLVRLHDIGKAAIPAEILAKPGALTPPEWEKIRRHSEIGFRIVKVFPETSRIAEEVLAHAERWDGSGYPKGLREKEIPFLARVFAVVDVFDVMTHPRPYARTLTREEAVAELKGNAGRQFDPELVDRFVAMITESRSVPAR